MARKVALALMAVLAVVTIGSAQTPAPSTAPKAAAKTGTKPGTKSATPAGTYDHALLHPGLLKTQAPASYQVKFTTSKGDFTVTVTRAWAPLGADRFYNLAKHRFFDNGSFFRVLNGFVAQFGLSAYPPVNAAWTKATIKDDPVTQSNKRGFLVFATAGPNTRTTQLFINLADNARLDASGFAPFGEVTDGMSVVDSLYQGYGEGAPQGQGPDQGEIEKQGKPYLDKGWPQLDFIKTATIVGAPAGVKRNTLPAKKTVTAPAKP